MKEKVIKIGTLILMLSGVFMTFSCTSYKSGFLQSSTYHDVQEDNSQTNIDFLTHKKQKLNVETKKIINSIKSYHDKTKSIRARDINDLFQNLNNQYNIDECFRDISTNSLNDSIRRLSRINLILAADFYSSNIQNDKLIRRIINRGDEGFFVEENTHMDSQYFLWSRKTQKKIIEQNIKVTSSNKTGLDFILQYKADNLHRVIYNVLRFGSELLGHLLFNAYLKPTKVENLETIIPYLKKWDIICIKSPYRLTDKFIPGYFGHVGIYLGNSVFAESTQKGVVYSNSNDFAEGKTFVIIRPKTITNRQNSRMMQVLRAQIGKSYDYNFNVESSDRIFCSELIYLVYEQIHWKTKRVLDYFTISPDYIAMESLENNKLFIPLYSKNGHVIFNPNQMTIRKLIP